MIDRETDEFGPDLEWMLQSGQVTSHGLAAVLVAEYSRQIYRFAWVLTGRPEAARNVVLETLAEVVAYPQRYPEGTRPPVWLLSLAISFSEAELTSRPQRPVSGLKEDHSSAPDESQAAGWREAVAPLPLNLKLPLLLHRAFGFTLAEVAQALSVPPATVEGRLDRVAVRASENKTLRRYLADGPDLAGDLEEGSGETALSSAGSGDLVAQIVARAGTHRRRRRRLTALGEVLFAALAIGLVAIALLVQDLRTVLPAPTQVPTVLVTQIVRVQVPATPASTSTPDSRYPAGAVFYRAAEGETLASIAAQRDMPLEQLRAWNEFKSTDPLAAGTLVVVGIEPTTTPDVPPTPVTPAAIPPALGPASSPEEIVERIRDSQQFWSTLWVEGWLISYGPRGHVGFGTWRRIQVWNSPPARGLVLAGPRFEQADEAWLGRDGRVYRVDRASGSISLEAVTEDGLSLPETFDLRPLIYPGELLANGRISGLGGIEEVGGRRALVVDWNVTGNAGGLEGISGDVRTWIDVHTGVILGERRAVEGPDGRTRARDLIIGKIAYDVPIPNEIFSASDPLSNFAQDYDGTLLTASGLVEGVFPEPPPENLPPENPGAPPPDFDLAKAVLDFIWFHPEDALGAASVEVFADGHYLGDVFRLDPWRGSCARSPDGRLLIFNSTPPNLVEIFWVDLRDLGTLQQPAERIVDLEGFALSPVDGRLALSGCSRETGECGLYLVALPGGEVRKLTTDFGQVEGMAWSPDGEQLAVVAPREDGRYLWVFEAETGQGVYWGRFAASLGGFPPDSPVRSWGKVPFTPGGIDACRFPTDWVGEPAAYPAPPSYPAPAN